MRDIISRDVIQVEKISTLVNPADMLTKAVLVGKFEEALNLLNILLFSSLIDCRVLLVVLHYIFRFKVEFVRKLTLTNVSYNSFLMSQHC